MTETAIRPDTGPEIDEKLLAEAMRGAGTSWRNEAINEALRAYVEAKREIRRQAREELRRMSDEGAFTYDEVDD